MRTLGILRDVCLVLAGVCSALFWIFGMSGLLDWIGFALIAGGAFAWIGIIIMIVKRVFDRHYII